MVLLLSVSPFVIEQTDGAVYRVRVNTPVSGIPFGSQHKTAADHAHDLKAGEI